MDITKVDAVSHGARVAQMAAGELYGLLASSDERPYAGPVNFWFSDNYADAAPATIDAVVGDLAGYVVARDVVQGETLYRYGLARNWFVKEPWELMPFERRQAFELFCQNCRATVTAIVSAQKAIEDARAEAPPAPKVAIEDTIYEPEEPLGTMRPEALAAVPLIAALDQGRYSREKEIERTRLRNLALAGQVEAAMAARAAQEPAPRPKRARKPAAMVPGEAVARRPVNAGGRGKKKSPAEKRADALARAAAK